MKNMPYVITASILISMSAFAADANQTAVIPPQGSAPLLEFAADGVQIYTCEAKGSGFEWTFKAPEANLFDKQGRPIGTHFAGPTRKMNDGSAIIGEVIAKADATETGAIQWLLLRAKSHKGSGTLSAAAYVRQIETSSGIAPKTGCDASHLSEKASVRYCATYRVLKQS